MTEPVRRPAARRIGLLGGSFDPVHRAHRALAEVALAQLGLDELRWVVAGRPWQKPAQQADAMHRAAMVGLAIADEPRFVLERCELERDGPSYTIDTVRSLQGGRPPEALPDDWFLVLGQDQYANFATWREWPELLARVTLAVAGRAGQPVEAPAALASVAHRVATLPMPASTLSSTDIRRRLRDGTSPDLLAPRMVEPAVASYIARLGLYRDPPIPEPRHSRIEPRN
ncbi:nicotinate (nicotinamide) nucleotide adenylyltransferase [Sphaerotilus hippei]|uniref:nicotinate (nicotinamide) nucleotide adenylyltransferase n=1 Tax=Sphaerotilus hippei TaxID=744406 RepID=UPI001FEC55A3|nr:nicotinate (nicotinamide) nucleotide adenylyltransferase [Sphaerotilus hippei]